MLLDVAGGDGSGYRDHQRLFAEFGRDFLQDFADDLRLYAEEHDVGAVDGLSVFGGDGDAEFFGERGGFFGVLYRGGDVFRVEEILLQVGAEQDAGEFAGAEHG